MSRPTAPSPTVQVPGVRSASVQRLYPEAFRWHVDSPNSHLGSVILSALPPPSGLATGCSLGSLRSEVTLQRCSVGCRCAFETVAAVMWLLRHPPKPKVLGSCEVAQRSAW